MCVCPVCFSCFLSNCPYLSCIPEELYVSEREGNDSTGDGTQKKPFKTVLKVSVENTCFVWQSVECVLGQVMGPCVLGPCTFKCEFHTCFRNLSRCLLRLCKDDFG